MNSRPSAAISAETELSPDSSSSFQPSHSSVVSDFQCEIGQWYVVDYADATEFPASRAIPLYAYEDGQTYMMHFADTDREFAVTIDSIFELDNPEEVYRIAPQVDTHSAGG